MKEQMGKWKDEESGVVFEDGKEMFDYIQAGVDLYSPEIETYLFLYNEDGEICEYSVDREKAEELKKLSEENGGEFWSAFLGVGGCIMEKPDDIKFCDENHKKTWFRV